MMPPPSPLALLAGLGMIAVAAGVVVAWWRRARVPFAFFGHGAFAWAVTVALKGVLATPANKLVVPFFKTHVPGVLVYVYLGVVAALFEVGGTWFFVRKTRVREAKRDEAIAFGLGFGAAEALLLGLLAFGGVVFALLFWHQYGPATRAQLGQIRGPIRIVMPMFERAYTVVVHLVATLLVVASVQRRRAGLFWGAFVFKASVDGLAAWCVDHLGLGTDAGYVKLELVIVAYVAVWALVTGSLARRASRPSP